MITLLLAALATGALDLPAAAAGIAHDLSDAAAKSRVVAVTAFSESGPSAAGRGGEIADLIAGQLRGATILDRAKVAALVGEARLKVLQGGAEVGKAAGAQALLAGSVSEAADGLLIEARLVSVSTGAVLASARRTAAAASRERAAGAVESTSIEVAMRKVADGLADGFARLPGSARYRRLAVLPFSELGDQAQKRQIGAVVTAEVTTILRRDHNLLLVERTKLSQVMGELRLQNSGAVDPASAGEIGKLADAQALVIGSAADAGDRYLIDARIVATESGETLAASSASVNASGMVALASDAVVLRSKKDAVFRSLLIPGWGQIYNRQAVKGGLILTAEVGLIGAGLAFHLLGDRAYASYTSQTNAGSLGSDPTGEAARLYDTASSRYQTRNLLFIAAGALWVANLVDAYVSGVDGDQLLSGPSSFALRF